MSTKYYLVDTEYKTFYELGKGGWYDFAYGTIKDKELLLNELLRVFWIRNSKEVIERLDTIDYIKEHLLSDLYNHFGHTDTNRLMVINDITDDLLIIMARGYRCIGTRYTNRSIEFLNRHLDPNTPKHLYDPTELKKWIGQKAWERF